jgi:hypothetical protein
MHYSIVGIGHKLYSMYINSIPAPYRWCSTCTSVFSATYPSSNSLSAFNSSVLLIFDLFHIVRSWGESTL